MERRDETGASHVEQQGSEGLGFCPDLQMHTVGVALERLLVGSKYVASDLQRLRELGVTHILNVAYGIPNAFTSSVSQLYRLADSYMVYIT